MSKRLQLDVQLIVDDDVTTERATDVLEAMLEDLEQDDNYHEVFVIDGVEARDEATIELLDMLDQIDEADVERAKNVVEEMEKDDDE